MINGDERRFTDREVALVLKRAAEMEERRNTEITARGLTRDQLFEIAREVGLSAEMVDSALADLHAGRSGRNISLLGADPLSKVVRAIPTELDQGGMQHVIQFIEDELAATGTVSEALGSVRWTSTADGHQFSHTTQVALTPGRGETQVQVTRRLSPRLQRILHILPPTWGAMIGMAVVASGGLALAPSVAVVGGSAAAGLAIGRAIWSSMARKSKARVESVAETVARKATSHAQGT